jgi:hypothetical protein
MKHSAPQFTIGPDGRKRGVVLELNHYRRLMRRIEDLEDALALESAVESSKKLIPYESVRVRLKQATVRASAQPASNQV